MPRPRKTALVTGYLGNLGVYVTDRLLNWGYKVVGVDNNTRGKTLGKQGSVMDLIDHFAGSEFMQPVYADIRNFDWHDAFPEGFDVIVHCASQVSHPRSIEIPRDDMEINILGTFNLLEYVRQHSEDSKFIYISSCKMYGENGSTNALPLPSLEIDESCSIDQTAKTPFGVSKAAADLYTQEWGDCYGLQTAVLRPSCFAGRFTKPTVWQRWEAQIINQILKGETVTIFGYEGKQVRDILHCDDLTDAIIMMINRMPAQKGDVFNIGGGLANAISVNDLIAMVERDTKIKAKVTYLEKRYADWNVFVTNNSKLIQEYPAWKVCRNLDFIIKELYEVLPIY